jgi:hypothetical protein
MRKIDLGLDLVTVCFRGTCRSGRGRVSLAGRLKMGAHFFRFVVFERTGMRLLLGDAHFREHVENCLALYFQLSCQIVDSNLAHPPSVSPNCAAMSS